MALLLDASVATKVQKMRSRVRWNAPQIRALGIDQTRLSIADGLATTPAFSFLVIGDSGFGPQPYGHPQQHIADMLVRHQSTVRFLLHTGDVVYQMGAPQQYPGNFIQPYREWLVGGEQPARLSYRQLLFRQPFLAIPGNHDYYNLPLPYGLVVMLAQPLRRLLGVPIATNVSLRGSGTGDTYARAFLDYLREMTPARLEAHLAAHYTSETDTGRCLTYQPNHFTRLPNRYYHFRYGGIDFFGLDSSTLNQPIEATGARLLTLPQVPADAPADLDWAQLQWFRDRLIASHQNPAVRGRILYLHHPPYVTEGSKLHERSCLCVRRHLRWALDAAAAAIGAHPAPLLDLTLSGHAHCFEYLRTMETGHADSHLNWLICGGSGARLRRQHPDTTTITEMDGRDARLMAKSQLFVGRSGEGEDTRLPYSFLRIDVQEGDRPQFVVRPFIAERQRGAWTQYEMEAIVL